MCVCVVCVCLCVFVDKMFLNVKPGVVFINHRACTTELLIIRISPVFWGGTSSPLGRNTCCLNTLFSHVLGVHFCVEVRDQVSKSCNQ